MYIPFIKIWQKRSLIFYLSLMNMKLQYKGTTIGFLWNVLEPLFVFLILYTVFSNTMSIDHPNYPLYLLSGIIFFQMFTRGTINGLSSLRNNSGIIKSLNITKEVFPTATTLSTILILLIHLGIFFSLMPLTDYVPSWQLLLLPIPIILLGVLVLGISFFLSVVSVYIKDVYPLWSTISYALLFISPIFWFVKDVEGILLTIYKINPFGHIVELVHLIIFNEPILFDELLLSTFYIFSIFAIGYVTFKKLENKVSEKL